MMCDQYQCTSGASAAPRCRVDLVHAEDHRRICCCCFPCCIRSLPCRWPHCQRTSLACPRVGPGSWSLRHCELLRIQASGVSVARQIKARTLGCYQLVHYLWHCNQGVDIARDSRSRPKRRNATQRGQRECTIWRTHRVAAICAEASASVNLNSAHMHCRACGGAHRL